MNIFLRELKAYRTSLIVWSTGLFLLVVSSMSKFGGMQASGMSANDLIAKMPKTLQVLMGTGTLDLSKANEYYGTIYIYVLLVGTLHAVTLGANILAKEEQDKTAEFLFVKPVTRNRIISSKLIAAVTNVLILNFVTMFSSIVSVDYYSKVEQNASKEILVLMAGMLILQLLFLGIGMAFSSLKKNSKTAASLSAIILLLTFVLSIAIDLNPQLDIFEYFTPFKYFKANDILTGQGLHGGFVILSLMIFFGFVGLTFFSFNKRDL